MEFILLPRDPIAPISKTPYVCHERYDGLPFLSYPVRKGKVNADTWSHPHEYHEFERLHPTSTREQESFIQTWLYFGLIAELLGANSQDFQDCSTQAADTSVERVNAIYDTLVVQDGDKSYIHLDVQCLSSLLELAISQLPTDPEARKRKFDHLALCLKYTHAVVGIVPKDFNHDVRFSICAFGEILSQMITFGYRVLNIGSFFVRNWAVEYLNADAKMLMITHGWCPSDITRAEAKFVSLQTFNIIRMMDKSSPRRDHSHCTNQTCKLYQIDTEEYRVGHQEASCSCEQLVVDSASLMEILEKDDLFPLISLNGDMDEPTADIVESALDIPYVAISHIWADGLGNPKANSLHWCKLFHLRAHVNALHHSEQQGNSDTSASSLIWLDTLCCPAEDGAGKDMAIEKIRLVYQRAKHVLVLDASLMAYDSGNLNITEQIMRIFTSSWFRRLWTLQEGALAESLYFQFADRALSLRALHENISKMGNDWRYRCFYFDIINEYWRLDAFFHSDRHRIPGPDLGVLDQALQYRAVSVPSDEALCIGTLMSLNLPSILSVQQKDDRMQKVWELIALSKGGIPSAIIFVEDKRIATPGWRWAPASLLTVKEGIFQPDARALRWRDSKLGTLTPLGLRVNYPGYRISMKQYRDRKPRNPWPGFEPIRESRMLFRDAETGQWYWVGDKRYGFLLKIWTTPEEEKEYNKLKLFPLHGLAGTDRAVIILRSAFLERNITEGIIALLADEDDARLSAVRVRTELHLLIVTVDPEEGYFHNTVEKLALRLRDSPMTDEHLMIKDHDSEEFKNSVKALKQEMRNIMRDAMDEDPRFAAAVDKAFGSHMRDHVWVLIHDWFHHDIIGTRIPEDQAWIVD